MRTHARCRVQRAVGIVASSSGGGGGGAIPPPPPIMLFRSFVGTFGNLSVHDCKPTSMSFVPTKFLKYTNKILKEIAVFKCENA